jgi:peptidyl-prolyl cis-trans isomerase B (cyclophilin B)
MLRMLLMFASTMFLVGCQTAPTPPPTPPPPPPSVPPAAVAPAAFAPPTAPQLEATKKAGKVQVKLETDKGDIVLELDGAAAPLTVANFVNLVKSGFYDGMPFHRVEPNFVIQAGAPEAVAKPPVGYTIPDEGSALKHDKGVIAMARLSRGGQMIPNSASTQFYLTLAPTPHLDSLGFTVFGRVTQGLDVIQKIAVGDKIRKATVG